MDQEVPIDWIPRDWVPRGRWLPDPSPRPMERMKYPLNAVYITNSESKICKTEKECLKIIKEVQIHHLKGGMFDIPFNFLIGGDGKIYEGRGWYWGSLLPYTREEVVAMKRNPNQDRSLVIAHIGRNIQTDPKHVMAVATKRLIDYGLENKKIKPEFETITRPYWVNYTISVPKKR